MLGLCGGYQMLGRSIADPHGLEGPPGETAGLGLLEVDTVLAPAKVLALREGLDLATGAAGARLRDPYGADRGPGPAAADAAPGRARPTAPSAPTDG